MQHIELTEKDVRNALQGTLDMVDVLRVTDNRENLIARGGFMLNMAFLDGDQPEVRERFWRLFELYCSVIPLKEMVWWWWGGRPQPFLSEKAQEQLGAVRKFTEAIW